MSVGVEPGNDEWSYAKAALAMHAGHGVTLQGFNQMFLVGQLIAGQPFLAALGDNAASLAVFGAVASVLWLGAVLALTAPMLGLRRALLLVLVLAVSPLFALLSPSYMSDVPAAASATVALLLGVTALERVSTGRFVAALLAVTVAFTVREQAVVVLATLLVAVLAKWQQLERRFRTRALASMALCLAGCLLLEQLRRGLPNGDTPPFGLGSISPATALDSLLRGTFTVAFWLAPLVAVAVLGRGRPRGRRSVLIGAATAAIAAVLLFTGSNASVLQGNYLEHNGAYTTALVGSPPPMFGSVTWPLIQIVAILAGAGLCCQLGTLTVTRHSLRRQLSEVPVRTLMLYAHGAMLAGVYLVLALLGEHQYDRYVLSLLPAVGVFLLNRPGSEFPAPTALRVRDALRWPVLCCAPMLAASAVVTVVTFGRDQAVWRSARWLTAHGIASTAINAGSAWDGWHATSPLERREQPGRRQYRGDDWAQRFGGSTDCYAVSLSPLPAQDWHLVRFTRARPYGTGLGSAPVFTYRRVAGRPRGGGTCRRQGPAGTTDSTSVTGRSARPAAVPADHSAGPGRSPGAR